MTVPYCYYSLSFWCWCKLHSCTPVSRVDLWATQLLCRRKLTAFVGQSSSSEANSTSASQKTTHTLCKPKVHCLIHSSTPLISITTRNHAVYNCLPISLRYTLILSHQCLGFPCGLFLLVFPIIIFYVLLSRHLCSMPH
jgi:hypothetical protein